jgi:Domain of unknown function (DUF1707)
VIPGPEQGAAAGHGCLRASHADREQVIGTLKTAFADGRLDKDELDTRVGQALDARTFAELATATAGIPAAPAQAPPPRRPALPPVNKAAVKRGLAAAGATIPPALFVTAAYGPHALALLALPLLFVELPVVIIFVVLTLARQHHDRSRASRGHLPPSSGEAGLAAEAGRHGSTSPDSASPGGCTGQASVDLQVHRSRRDRRGQGVPVPSGARPAPGSA